MKKILLCTDGSEYSRVCAQYASAVAKQSGAAIDALYLTDIRKFEVPLVADLSGSLGIQPYHDVMNNIERLEEHKAEFLEEATRKYFEEAGLADRFNFHHRTGLIVDSLEGFEEDVDMILMGKRGENSEHAAGHLGSNMERVLRAAKKPCMVTSREFRAFRKILVAYDGGESCKAALDWLAEAEWLHDTELHMVIVPEEYHEHKATTSLRQAEEKMEGTGFTLHCQVLGGVAEESIAKYVSENDIDLLVMGAYGHSRIRYLLIGSTTTAMIRSCHIPVLCFR